MAAAGGGMLLRAQVAEFLRVSSGIIDQKLRDKGILGVPWGEGIGFPAAQFLASIEVASVTDGFHGRVVPGLPDILESFGGMDEWGQLQLLVTPLEGFAETSASILQMLATGVDRDTLIRLCGLVRGWSTAMVMRSKRDLVEKLN